MSLEIGNGLWKTQQWLYFLRFMENNNGQKDLGRQEFEGNEDRLFRSRAGKLPISEGVWIVERDRRR